MKYSFVVPIYNDGELARDFCRELEKVFAGQLQQTELIFVDDGSRNDSIARLQAVAEEFPFVRVIQLSRNFGQHIAVSAGYAHASGEYVGYLNVDMEDPPDQIPLLLKPLEAGEVDIALGIRSNRRSTWFTRLTSVAFNAFLNRLTGYKLPLNIATLRVMNRRFADAYNQLSEKSRFLPGLEAWLGYRHAYVPIHHQLRARGKSSYNLRRRLSMAMESVISFSDLPLRIAIYSGFALAAIGFALAATLMISKLFFTDYRPGYTSTLCAIVFVGGMQMLMTGFAGLYIGRILREVQNRPTFLIRQRIGFERRAQAVTPVLPRAQG